MAIEGKVATPFTKLGEEKKKKEIATYLEKKGQRGKNGTAASSGEWGKTGASLPKGVSEGSGNKTCRCPPKANRRTKNRGW